MTIPVADAPAPDEYIDQAERNTEERRHKHLQRERMMRDRDLRQLLSIPAFQRFTMRMMDDAEAFSRSWDTSKRRLIKEGRAMLALELWAEIERTNPDAIAKMLVARVKTHKEL